MATQRCGTAMQLAPTKTIWESSMSDRHARRDALKTLGLAAGTVLLAATRPAHAAAPDTGTLLPGG
ncbi:TPA: twin-arginine translocation signal domain-containing protein, partial [Burkholderia cenocepacia]